jgi:hypothetical protein
VFTLFALFLIRLKLVVDSVFNAPVSAVLNNVVLRVKAGLKVRSYSDVQGSGWSVSASDDVDAGFRWK